MTKKEYEKLLLDLEILFDVDEYEELLFPIVKDYLFYRLGKKVNSPAYGEFGFWSSNLGAAFTILGITE